MSDISAITIDVSVAHSDYAYQAVAAVKKNASLTASSWNTIATLGSLSGAGVFVLKRLNQAILSFTVSESYGRRHLNVNYYTALNTTTIEGVRITTNNKIQVLLGTTYNSSWEINCYYAKNVTLTTEVADPADVAAQSIDVTGNNVGEIHTDPFAINNALTVTTSTGTDTLYAANTGDVGIGTTAPAYKLDVVGASRIQNELTLGDNTSAVGKLHFRNPGAGSYIQSNGYYIFNTLRGLGNQFRIKHATASSELDIYALTDDGLWYLTPRGPNSSNGTLAIRNPNNSTKFTFNTNNGNFGIGTTAPTKKLEVVGDIASQGIYVDRTHEGDGINEPFAKFGLHYFHGDANTLKIEKPSGTSSISFSTQNGNVFANSANGSIGLNGVEQAVQSAGGTINVRIVQHNAANNNYGKYISVTNSTNATGVRGRVDINGDLRIVDYSTSSAVEKTKIKNDGSAYFSGNVGIGTTSPSTLLHLRGDSPTLRIEADGANESSIIELVQDGGVTGAAIKYNGASNIEALQFNTGVSDTRMTIKRATGNVGIGTTSPDTNLHVDGYALFGADTSTGYYFGPANRFSIGGQRVLEKSGASVFVGYNASQLIFRTNNLERGRFDINGNLGIGTTAPANKLTVDGVIEAINSNGPSHFLARFDSTYFTTYTTDSVRFDGTGQSYSFIQNGSTRMRIDSAGNVGIGTTNPGSKLQVNGTAMSQFRMEIPGGPSSNTDTSGREGDFAYDDQYLYIKTGNGWGRVALDFGF